MKILLVTHHWGNNTHHSKYSGYQRLAHFLSPKNNVTLITLGHENKTYFDENLKVIILSNIFINNPILRRIILSYEALKISKGFDLVHYLYSDTAFFLPKNSFVTLHVLPSIVKQKKIKQKLFYFAKNILFIKRALRNANRIICISSNINNRLKSQYKNKSITILHGIDTKFWNSSYKTAHSNKRILCVGSHGTDINSLKNIIKKFNALKFTLVGINVGDLNCSNYISKFNITDDELKQLYNDSDLFFRPVIFSTANNSILEAMAMELPIVTKNIDGITDYLDNNSAYLANSDSEYSSLITEALNDKDKTQFKVDNAINLIKERFCWRKISLETENYYKIDLTSKNI